MAHLKTTRASAKRAVTKKINFIRQCIAEDDIENLSDHVTNLKDLFKVFTSSHNEYHETLVDDGDVDESDTYFYKQQENYVSVLQEVKGVIKDVTVKPEPDKPSHTVNPGAATDHSHEELLKLLNLPKVELQVFDGNPLHFHQFMKAFEVNVDKVCEDSDLKLSRLMQYTTGVAKEAIRGCQLTGGTAGYAQACSILHRRFGNSYLVTERLVKNLRFGKPARSPLEIQQLADDMQNAFLVFDKSNMMHEVNSQSVILEILSRLPNYIQIKWKKIAMESKKTKDSYPGFKDLVKFVADMASEVNDPVYGYLHFKRSDKPRPKQDKASSSFTTSLSNSRPDKQRQSNDRSMLPNPRHYAKPDPPCLLCRQPHRLWHCEQFKRMNPRERLSFAISNKLCHSCLLSTHSTDNCGKRSVCGVRGCGQKHTMYIHCVDNAPAVSHVSVSNASVHVDRDTFMPLVRVLVNNTCKATVLLDSGSSNSFCSSALVNRLGIQGMSHQFKLSTLNKSDTRQSQVVDLMISGDNGETLEINGVYVVDSIPVKGVKLDLNSYDHLCGIGTLPAYCNDTTVDLLLGQDNAEALVPLEVKRGGPGQPFAVRTLFGWCLNGRPPVAKVSRQVISNFVTITSVQDDVSRLWDIEHEGLDRQSWSQEDKAVIGLWDRECRKVDGHYELPIPWRDREEPLPNNFPVAKHRLDSLLKRLAKDELHQRYDDEIVKLLDGGYAEKVPPHELQTKDRTWYLPHHCVLSDKKPDKLRVVFDCASKFGGKSLNERCLQGPNLTNQLLPVLLRFRQHSIAIQADIEAMYNQVRIPFRDRDALRFLWHVDGDLACFRMTSHLFGGVWCSSSSTYALHRTITDCSEIDPLVRHTVEKSFYVDDCLCSVTSREDAEMVIKGTPKLLSQGGFNLTKFVVNKRDLLEDVSTDCRAKEVRELDTTSESRALGIKWMVSSDEFFFQIGRDMSGPVTRRMMLSIVSSVFDPLGLIGPVILTGKLLFQEATARKLAWDEVMPLDLEGKWRNWVQSLHDIMGDFRIPRCIKPRDFDEALVELHHFSDASQQAYGCVSYIRCVNKLGEIHVQLIMSKNRVAPLKSCTIPRLELQAAVLAAKVDGLLRQELDVTIDGSYFWTDSEIVLKYIANDSRRFHVFVGNRISVIREFSDPGQWFYIGTKVNPADLVTRGQSVIHEKWLNGPVILHDYKSAWDIENHPGDLSPDDPEVRRTLVCDVTAVDDHPELSKQSEISDHPLDQIMKYSSSWYGMKRSLAWWLRFVRYLKGDRSTESLSAREINHAGKLLIARSQSQSFDSEIQRLKLGKPVLASSPLRALNPYLDNEDLLRVGGRLQESGTENKHPCILSADHTIVATIVNDIHRVAHVGVEWVLSIMRKQFWVIRARPLVKKIVKSCIECKRLYGKSHKQLMANLPKERVDVGKPPFTHVGIDVFGPFYVKLGRSEVKRYGCLFTCLCIRAVHIEVLNSLETDSFLNGFRRFAARRGHPEVVYSDQGTNFIGGEAELKHSIRELSQKFINAYAVKYDMRWHFNPPTASHMGGAWERLIGVIKRILVAILPRTTRLTDEILHTVFCEAESIVNNRPLTKLSDDPRDSAPLTPNHLLILRDNCCAPPGKFDSKDIFRKRWRHVQHLANQFWYKWLRLYLPELQKRSKWTAVKDNLAIGDLVLLVDELTPRNLWPLARIVDVIHGRDGLVRTVRVKTRSTELVRPVTKIVPLECVHST